MFTQSNWEVRIMTSETSLPSHSLGSGVLRLTPQLAGQGSLHGTYNYLSCLTAPRKSSCCWFVIKWPGPAFKGISSPHSIGHKHPNQTTHEPVRGESSATGILKALTDTYVPGREEAGIGLRVCPGSTWEHFLSSNRDWTLLQIANKVQSSIITCQSHWGNTLGIRNWSSETKTKKLT